MSTIDGAKDGHEADAPHDNPTLRPIRLDTVERALEDIAAGKETEDVNLLGVRL